MEIKGVIFDLDGTLVDSIEDIAIANNKMLEQFHYPTHNIDKYIEWIGNGAKQLVVKSLPAEILENESRVDDCLRTYTELYKTDLVVKSKLYSGIDTVLEKLEENGIPKSILTNKPHDLAVRVAELLLSNWKFNYIFGQQLQLSKKPDPAVAIKISESYGIKPENIAFIGDSTVDVQTAINAGMQAIAVSWGYDSLQSVKDTACKTIVDTSEELLELLKTKTKHYENKSS